MDIKGWILKIDIDTRLNRALIVIKDINHRYREIPIYYTPKAYIHGDDEEAIRLIKGFKDDILDVYKENWRLPPWYNKDRNIYVIRFSGISEYYRFVRYLRNSYYTHIKLYNTIPAIPQKILLDIGVPPSLLANIHIDGGFIDAYEYEDRESINYIPPPFKRILIRGFNWYGENSNPWRKEPEKYIIYVNGNQDKLEVRNIDTLIEYINYYDPDVIEYTNPILHKWLVKKDGVKEVLHKRRRVYINYGSTVLEPSEYHGLIELSRLSYTDLGRVSKYSIGKILTTIEAVEALKRHMAIPEYRVDIEKPKKLTNLYKIDRGGLYYIPTPGLYWNIAQCDFTSLYPNIIVKYNISNETVNREGCKEYIVTPIGIHKICMDVEGIVPMVLNKLIRRRVVLKDLAKETRDPIYYARQNAIKWILVACFGYLGYRNARFGKIEAYESVTAYARYILNKTINIAKKHGYKVIHAIVDSIWVYKEGGTREDYIKLCREISREIGIRMELDIHYKWLYLPKNMSRPPIAQSNRYYGVGYNGEIKVKGIELVRRDTPPIIKRFQKEAINILSKATDIEDMRTLLKKVLSLHSNYISIIANGEAPIKDLLITKRITRRWYEYRGNNLFIDAVKRFKLREGEVVKFIVDSKREAIPIEYWSEDMGYSKNYYINRLNKSIDTLPIEYAENRLISLENFIGIS